jgi:REP element-mobilizing transposase RayT
LKGYDYSQTGAYFVTICTRNRACLFGDIADGKMVLNGAGHAAADCWYTIPEHFPHAQLGAFMVMPNHIPGILFIVGAAVGAKNFSPPQRGQRPRGTSKTIGSIIRGFKIGVTRWMRRNTAVEHVWQRNYYERVIRNEDELNHIRQYIEGNPAQWESDRENPNWQKCSNISGMAGSGVL